MTVGKSLLKSLNLDTMTKLRSDPKMAERGMLDGALSDRPTVGGATCLSLIALLAKEECWVIWVIFVIVATAILFFVLKPKAQPTVRQDTRDAHFRAADLASDERAALAAKVRSTALNGYDTIAAAARNAGKDDIFAHQVGVLQALTAVVMPGRQPTGQEQRELQMETAPFTKGLPAEGRMAIAEYLVWKLFREHADEAVFAPALRRFRDEIHGDGDVGDDVTFGLLYSMKYDWQRWLSEHRDANDG